MKTDTPPTDSTGQARHRVRELAVCAALWAIVGGTYAAIIRPGHVWGDDFALYVKHAQNIAEGHPYGDTGYIYNPHNPEVGPPSYPPLFPLMMSPIIKVAGLNFAALKALQIVFMLAFLAVTLYYFADELRLWERAAVVLILGFNRYFLDEVNSLGSDIPFLLFVFLFLSFVKLAYRDSARPNLAWAIGVAILMYLAYATRTVGVILPPTLVVHEIVRRRWIRYPVVLACMGFVALAGAHSLILASERRYLDQFGVDPMIHIHNAARYLSRFLAFWQNGISTPVAAVVGVGLGILAIVGLGANVRRRIGLNEVFCACYLAIVFAWPTYCDARLLYPVFPIYLCYVFQGLRTARQAVPPTLSLPLCTIVVVVVFASEGAYLVADSPLTRQGVLGVGQEPAQELFQFVREDTEPNDVFIFVKPRALALFTGRASSAYFMPEDDERLWKYTSDLGAKYIVVVEDDVPFDLQIDPVMLTYLREFAARNMHKLNKVYSNSGFSVYEIERATSPEQAGERPDYTRPARR